MSVELVISDVRADAAALMNSPVLLAASEAAALIPAVVIITSDEEDATYGDLALASDKGAKHVEVGLTDIFRPVKAFEKMFREHMRERFGAPLAAATKRVNDASRAYRNEKAARAAAAQREAERVAREAAEAAARAEAERVAAAEVRRIEAEQAAAAGLPAPPEPEPDIFAEDSDGFDVAPGVAQVIAPPVETIARGETSLTFDRRTIQCALEEDGAARKAWPGAFLFDERAALAAFKESGAVVSQADLDSGVLLGGVRFYNKIDTTRRAR